MATRYLTLPVLAGLGLLGLAEDAAAQAGDEDVFDLTIEQLVNAEVMSVSRRPERVFEAAASIDVITNDDIHRSGAQTLPEVLRLARNLEVAQIDAQRYAISARGFNTYEASNKLLVLIDGRSVYTPLYSGVFWDQLHVPLQDIERIEVISGPGGTLWGANAVNGVINIITQSAADTQGFAGSLFAGDIDRRADLRYGGAIGQSGQFRVFASAFELGDTLTLAGADGGDGGSGVQGGFRADWGGVDNSFMLQGGLYDDEIDAGGQRRGAHMLGRWRRQLEDGGALETQIYFSNEERDAALRSAPGTFDTLETWDVSFQHNLRLGERHQIVWGGGYRHVDSEFINTLNPAGFDEPQRVLETANVFVQDEIALTEDVALTLGLKLEDHTFTGLEYMPNVRLAWRPDETFMVWGAISRAVRTPSRIDEELTFIGFPGFITTFTFESEELLAYELGVRAQPLSNATVSATFYRHEYEGLRTSSLSPPPPGGFPVFVGNGLEGEVYGLEVWGDLAISDNWRLSAGLTLLESEFRTAPLSSDVNGSGEDPGYQLFIRSEANLTDAITFDLDLRTIEEVNAQVPTYTALNARLGWRLNDQVEVALAGRNLLNEAHPESFDIAPLLQARRSFQLSLHVSY
jgi:iron complex outermembrane receptor protein